MTTELDAIAKHYNQYGWAVIRNVYSAADMQPLVNCIEHAVDEHARHLYNEKKITDLHVNEPFERRMALLYKGHENRMRSWDDIVTEDALKPFLFNNRLLDALQSVLGPDVTYTGNHRLRPKVPGSMLTAFPWHQDSQYYGAPTKPLHITTVWIPLVDTDETNGGLWVISGSHRWGLLKGERGADQNIRTFEDVEKRGTPFPIRVQRGDVLIFTNLTFHASRVNQTEAVRWSLDLRFLGSTDQAQMTPDQREGLAFFVNQLTKQELTLRALRGKAVPA